MKTSHRGRVVCVQVVDSANPIVFARLGSDPAQPTITIHGHYDVQVRAQCHRRGTTANRFAAANERVLLSLTWSLMPRVLPQPADTSDWDTDPFVLTGQDGYLYGRGYVLVG